MDCGSRIGDFRSMEHGVSAGSLQQAGGIVIAAVYYETLFSKSEIRNREPARRGGVRRTNLKSEIGGDLGLGIADLGLGIEVDLRL